MTRGDPAGVPDVDVDRLGPARQASGPHDERHQTSAVECATLTIP